jgi:hypothetical protein
VNPGVYYDSGGPTGNYGINENWVQLIQCDPSFGVVVLRLAQLATECGHDHLRIYDGPSSSASPLFMSSCSTPGVSASNPLVRFSSTNQVYVKFTSDSITNGAGYTLQYVCTPVIPFTSSTATSGTLHDTGGAGGQYGNNESTLAQITDACPIGYNFQLTFTELDIDGSMPSCPTDSLKIIYSGVVKNTFCGTLTGPSLPQVSVGASSALILFTSDSSITRAGYSLDYDCVGITSGNVQYTSGLPFQFL